MRCARITGITGSASTSTSSDAPSPDSTALVALEATSSATAPPIAKARRDVSDETARPNSAK